MLRENILLISLFACRTSYRVFFTVGLLLMEKELKIFFRFKIFVNFQLELKKNILLKAVMGYFLFNLLKLP